MAEPKKSVRAKRRKIRLKKKKVNPVTESCEELKTLFSNSDENAHMHNPKYTALLRCMSTEDRASFIAAPDSNNYLYPQLDDPNFNEKIATKKEFYDCKYEEKKEEEFDNIKEIAQILCDNTEFELEPHQMFVRNFMSFQTPYNGLLLFHGLGTGKTCSAISVCEEMRTYLQQLGITKRIIIVASPAVQENFKIQLFDERKLKNVNGMWNIKACTGNKFLKEVNPMNMRGLPRNRIIRQIKRIINQSYHFQGYIEFSNYISRIMQRAIHKGDDKAKQRRKIERILKKEFSNRMLVIDEVHNLRVSDEGIIKQSSENLLTLVATSENLKLLLLSATPMFNSYTEIIWLINLLNLNDKRFPISESEIFDRKGNFVVDKGGREVGKELLVQKIIGYISYVRGENPFTFPYTVYPAIAGNPFSLITLMNSSGWTYPSLQLNNASVVEPIHLLDLTVIPIGSYQELGYQFLFTQLRQKYPILNDPNKGLPYTVLESPLQALNIIYPHKNLNEELDEGVDPDDVTTYLYGHRGLARLMNFNERSKSEFKYKDSTLRDFGHIFSSSEIGKYSGKIKYICEKVKQSKGIIFIYSQYIDGGAVPLALALEEMGITRYGDRNLFTKRPVPPIDALTMQPDQDGNRIRYPAKYIMITGDKNLTPNLKVELKAVTADNNINGERVKVIIVSRAGSEGLDFKNIRQTHILDPWYNLNREDQIVGRAVRNFSHCALPYEERNVEIYMYGTQLSNNTVEAADLYVYRLAERKAKKIAIITRILKVNAVDCLLNRAALDFSEEKMNKVVSQTLSSGSTIEYRLGDKANSAICDFTACTYTCNSRVQEIQDVDTTSYNETFIIMNLDKILQRIRLLYREQYIYKRTDLISAIVQIKNYPLDQIYTALDFLVTERNEYITDMLDRLGHLVNIGDFYMFQPVELEDKYITRYERTHPISFKRDILTYTLPDTIPTHGFMSSQDRTILYDSKEAFDQIMLSLTHNYNLLQNPVYIASENKENWAMAAAWAIRNLVKYNKFSYQKLVELSVYHLLDILDYNTKVILLKNIYFKEVLSDLEAIIKSYFDQYTITYKELTGIVLSNFTKPAAHEPYTILTLMNQKWKHNKQAVGAGLAKAMFEKFQVTDLNKVSNIIGFMTIFKRHEIVFKTKELKLSSQGRTNKGHRCDRGEVKKKIMKRINALLSTSIQPQKYIATKNTITSIYGDTDIKQYALVKEIQKEMRHNSLQLCVENELILRLFNFNKRDDKIWFFSTLSTTINNIMAIGRK